MASLRKLSKSALRWRRYEARSYRLHPGQINVHRAYDRVLERIYVEARRRAYKQDSTDTRPYSPGEADRD